MANKSDKEILTQEQIDEINGTSIFMDPNFGFDEDEKEEKKSSPVFPKRKSTSSNDNEDVQSLSSEEKKKAILIYLPEKLFKSLKLFVCIQETTIKEFVISAIREKIQRSNISGKEINDLMLK